MADANTLYPKGREGFLTGQIDWLTDDIKVSGLTDAYTYAATHEFYTDLVGVVFDSSNFTGKDATDGVGDADDILEPTVSGSDVKRLIIWQDTGVPATSRLIAYYGRTASSVLIVASPDGGPFQIVWPNGPTKLFRL